MNKLNVGINLFLIVMLALCYADKQKRKNEIITEVVEDVVKTIEIL